LAARSASSARVRKREYLEASRSALNTESKCTHEGRQQVSLLVGYLRG
jgi:hypothetical protein